MARGEARDRLTQMPLLQRSNALYIDFEKPQMDRLMAASKPLRTVADYRNAGIAVISQCSRGEDHSHFVDLSVADQDAELDLEWRQARTCPECGAPGGGLTFKSR